MKTEPIVFDSIIPFTATSIEGRVINYSLSEGDITTYVELISDSGAKDSSNIIITKDDLEELSVIVESTLKGFFQTKLGITFTEGSGIEPKSINSLSSSFTAIQCDIIIKWYNLFSPENTKILIIFKGEAEEESEQPVMTYELDVAESELEILTTSTGDPFLVRPILREALRLKLEEVIQKDVVFITEEEE